MIAFTVLYGILAVIEFGLMFRAIKVGPEPIENHPDVEIGGDENRSLVMAY
jgi:cytochrome bd-type quinol oxidase subunit 1